MNMIRDLAEIKDYTQWIALTWNPDPNRHGLLCIKMQYTWIQNKLLDLLYKSTDDFVISPELTLTSNVHIHGIIKLGLKQHQKCTWYKLMTKLRRNGFICVKNKINEDWVKYILKDTILMKGMLEQSDNIPYYRLDERHNRCARLLRRRNEQERHEDMGELSRYFGPLPLVEEYSPLDVNPIFDM